MKCAGSTDSINRFLFTFIILLVVLADSCIMPSYFSECRFINNTSHQITTKKYRNGVIMNNTGIDGFNLNIAPNQYVDLPNDYKDDNLSTFLGVDSIQVYFDNKKYILHYAYINNGQRVFLPTDSRSLFNREVAYQLIRTHPTKHSTIDKFTYTFTEQDYLNAK